MGTVVPWNQLYAVALRRNVDLSEHLAGTDMATVTNAGVVSTQGRWLFCPGDPDTPAGSYGIPTGTSWAHADEVFGVPVTNRPVFEMGQEVNEYSKAIGTPVPTAGTGYNFLKGSIGPTTSFEFDFEKYTAMPFLFATFQRGASITKFDVGGLVAYDGQEYLFQCPTSAAAPTPSEFLSVAKTQDFPYGELISDAIVTRMVLSGTENEPIKCTFDLLGRQYSTHDFANEFGTAGTAPALGIVTADDHIGIEYNEINPLMFQDCIVCIGNYLDGATLESTIQSHLVVEASSFEITVTANLVPIRNNSRMPRRFVVSGYTVEGSISFPYGSTTVGGTYLAELIMENTSVIRPIPIDIFWLSSSTLLTAVGTTVPGTSIDTTDMGYLRNMQYGSVSDEDHAVGDLHIGVGALPKAAPDENADETMITLNFTGADIRSGNTVTAKAFRLSWLDTVAHDYFTR